MHAWSPARWEGRRSRSGSLPSRLPHSRAVTIEQAVVFREEGLSFLTEVHAASEAVMGDLVLTPRLEGALTLSAKPCVDVARVDSGRHLKLLRGCQVLVTARHRAIMCPLPNKVVR